MDLPTRRSAEDMPVELAAVGVVEVDGLVGPEATEGEGAATLAAGAEGTVEGVPVEPEAGDPAEDGGPVRP